MTIEQAIIRVASLKTTLAVAKEARDFSQVEDLLICIHKAELTLQKISNEANN